MRRRAIVQVPEEAVELVHSPHFWQAGVMPRITERVSKSKTAIVRHLFG